MQKWMKLPRWPSRPQYFDWLGIAILVIAYVVVCWAGRQSELPSASEVAEGLLKDALSASRAGRLTMLDETAEASIAAAVGEAARIYGCAYLHDGGLATKNADYADAGNGVWIMLETKPPMRAPCGGVRLPDGPESWRAAWRATMDDGALRAGVIGALLVARGEDPCLVREHLPEYRAKMQAAVARLVDAASKAHRAGTQELSLPVFAVAGDNQDRVTAALAQAAGGVRDDACPETERVRGLVP